MNKTLADLIKISNAAGKDPTFVQGGGGNTSVKTDDGRSMYIKASGTALKEMNAKKGWRRVNLDAVRSIIDDKSLLKLPEQKRETEVVNKLLLACDDNIKDGSRPSVEAHLHSYLNKCVIHLHPSAIGAYVNAKDGKANIEKLFKNDRFPPLWVPYADPGFLLAKLISKLTTDYKAKYGKPPAILFLDKHGLFVTAGTPAKALKITRQVIAECNKKLKQPKAKVKNISKQAVSDAKLCIRKAYFDATGKYITVSYFYGQEIESFMREKNARAMLSGGPLAPDELVYSNGPAIWVDKCLPDEISSRLKSQINRGGKPSMAFLIKDLGLLVAGKKKIAQTTREIAESSFFVRANAYRLGGIKALTKKEQDFINKWESESFRKALASGAAAGDLQDRITVVTGAGSGLGRSIAIGLARAGAAVAIADIDIKAAGQTKQIIVKELPDSTVTVVKCNVTDETSVNSAFDSLLDEFGGLDVMVNAAGVAPAGALVDLPVDKWRFALEVNLTGYFLMAKTAARIMTQQAIGGSIINLSSKSGLEASKNNSPYNATKAGEIHMARGWAMELGKFGIRVNSVCPGNVFEGSKIWNPAYIKVCAKKYGIKPDQVIPHYVSKTILNKEIKGQDIADAVVFLASDRSRMITGQTMVVDAGQVMVR